MKNGKKSTVFERKHIELFQLNRGGILMKSTGIARKVDELGRVVIPKELRRTLEINEKDPMEIYVEDEKIILKKYVPNNACTITGEVTADNFRLLGTDIIVSPKGAEILLEHLKRELNKKSV